MHADGGRLTGVCLLAGAAGAAAAHGPDGCEAGQQDPLQPEEEAGAAGHVGAVSGAALNILYYIILRPLLYHRSAAVTKV